MSVKITCRSEQYYSVEEKTSLQYYMCVCYYTSIGVAVQVLGEENHSDGTNAVLHLLQQPKLNKQVLTLTLT